jgi:hypothetical protein
MRTTVLLSDLLIFIPAVIMFVRLSKHVDKVSEWENDKKFDLNAYHTCIGDEIMFGHVLFADKRTICLSSLSWSSSHRSCSFPVSLPLFYLFTHFAGTIVSRWVYLFGR